MSDTYCRNGQGPRILFSESHLTPSPHCGMEGTRCGDGGDSPGKQRSDWPRCNLQEQVIAKELTQPWEIIAGSLRR